MCIRDSFTTDQLIELYEVFDCFCDSRTQTLRLPNLTHAITNLGLEKKNPIIMGIIYEMESQVKDTPLSFDKFIQEITNRLGNPTTQQGRQRIFQIVDGEKKGSISFEDLKNLAREIGYNISDAELFEVLKSIAPNSNVISYADYERHMARRYDLE
eukprot:TRINITY_DN7192_c0_g2_i2.p1 TRINITY_DN7192_c0_g2~~TRINITY_DN7192_c0_g2_i2.p1  ORF type:complete len:156 (-),score=36.82 TRINITY_DN7192_c0_g2_i2:110-577(-)